MAVYKATQKKRNSSGTFKATENKSVDSSMIYGWEKMYNESYDALEKYRKRIEGGEYLSSDDLSAYEKAMNSYVDAASNMRFLSKSMGKNDIDDKDWENSVSQMRENFKGIYDHYSRWDTKEKYDSAVAANKDYEEKKSLDVDAAWKYVEDWESAAQGYIDYVIEPSKHDYEPTEEEIAAAVSKLSPYIEKYGGMDIYGDITDMLGIIEERKAYINDAKRIQEGIRLASVADSSSELYDPEFDKYAQQGASIENPEVEDVQGSFSIGSWNPFGEDPKNKVAYTRDNWDYYVQQSAGRLATSGSTKPEYYQMNKLYTHMTEQEVSIYNYYLAKYGEAKADEYLNTLMPKLEAIEDNKFYENVSGFAEQLPISATLLSIFSSVASGGEYIGDLIDYGTNRISDPDAKMDKNQLAMTTNIFRGTVADKVDWEIGNWDAFDFLYNTTMSGVDSVVAGVAFGNFGGVALGLSAAAQGTNDALERGMSSGQAFWNGLFSGAFECLFETVSIGQFNSLKEIAPQGIKDILKNLGKTMLVNASEETLTEIANIAYDTLVNGEFANYTLEELKNGAWKNALQQVVEAGASGALMGLGMGAVGNVRGYSNRYTQTGRTIMGADGGVDALKNLANEIAGVSSEDMQSILAKQVDKVDKKATAKKVGKLYDTVQMANNQANAPANQADIAKSLMRKGFSSETANDIAGALVASYNGQELTKAQQKLLKSAQDNSVVQDAISNIMDNTESTMGQRSQNIRDFQKDVVAGRVAKAYGVSVDTAKEMLEGKHTTEEKSLPESSYEVSVEGKTIDSNGDVINIVGVESVKDGKMVLKTEDGTIDSSEVRYASEADALIYEAVANMGASPSSAWAMIKAFNEADGITAQAYATAAPLAYLYGKLGYEKGVFVDGKPRLNLTATQSATLYQLGRSDAEASVNATNQSSTESTISEKNADKEIVFEGFTYSKRKANDVQKASMETIELINKMSNLEVHVYQSYKKDGKLYAVVNGKERLAPNGYFTDGNKVYVDINAGNMGEGLMLYTLSHEVGHYIAKWNAQDFKAISDFLFAHYGENVPVYDLLEAQKNKLKKSYKEDGKPIPSDAQLEKEAHEELVCDMLSRMLADTNAYDKLMELKQKDLKLHQKLGQAIKKALDKLAKLIGVYNTQSPDFLYAASAENIGEEAFRQLQDLYIKAFVQADANFQSSLTPGEEGIVVNQNGDPVAQSTADGTVQLSMRTYEEDGRNAFRSYLEKCVKSKKLTKAEMQEMMDGIEDIYQTCKEFKDKYAPFSAWSDAAVVRDTYGKPVFSVVTPNGDYKMNLDFSLVCKKRRTLDAVFNEMSRRGIIDDFELGQKSVVKINEIIRKYGLETACALCFVDAKRFRQASMADSFTRLYNELVKSLVPESQSGNIEHFNFSGYDTIAKVADGVHTWDSSKLDFSHIDEVMKNYGTGTVEYKAAKYIKTHPEGRKLLLRGDFMSSKGFDAVKTQNPDVLRLYNSKKGTGGPKAAFGDVQYMNEIIKKAKTWTPAKAYEVGGVRIQSFSDYVPRMVFDYTQMIYDLAATKLPAHAYTKEALFVKQFGLTGVKINMSLIPAIAEGGIAPGLDADGNYVWAGESFDFETAKEIQNAEGYTENCGTICVGVSHDHIVKLLRDPDIRMVIPYHKSGLNPIVAHMNKIAQFHDYTSDQRTKGEDGKMLDKDFDFSKALHDMGENASPKAVADQYLKWCVANGYTARFAEFAAEENYYKMLEDFTLYDKDGNYVPQREVRAVFPNESSAFGSMKDLIKSGLEEDAIVEGKRDKNLSAIVDEIQNTIPKTEAEIEETQVEQADRDLEEIQFSIREEFYKEFDAWDGKNANVTFVTGTTSDPLKSIGMKDQDIVLRSGTVLQKLKDHPEMTRDIFRNIPELLEHPVIVQFSDAIDPKTKKPKYKSSITVLGELYADVEEDGKTVKKPVLVSLELLPTNQKKTAVLDFAIIKSAYSKDALQQYINDNSILYIDPDKKRTDSWLSLNRLQLPLGEKSYGPIRKIAYVDGKVKVQNSKNMTAMEKAMLDAGVIDEFGNKLFSDRDNAPTFYSQMAKVVEGVKQEKLGASSVVNMLRGKGVKAEEIKWSGIEAWLEGKKSVTKAELQEFIAGSMLHIEEEVLTNEERPYSEERQKRLDEYTTERDKIGETLAAEWKRITGEEFPIRNLGAGVGSDVESRIRDVNLEYKKSTFEGRLLSKLRGDLKEVIANNDDFGFDSWKEALISIHRNRKNFVTHYEMSIDDKAVIIKYCNALNAYNEMSNKISEEDTDTLRDIAENIEKYNRKIIQVMNDHYRDNAKYMAKWGQYKLKGGENYREVIFKIPGSYYTNDAMDMHWGEDRNGVLAHARIQDLNTFLGKMLFIEEIQSDWHNDGHKDGYANEVEAVRKRIAELSKQWDDLMEESMTASATRSYAINEKLDAIDEEKSRLEMKMRNGRLAPDAPFRNNYHEYVLKRLIREAAEKGYDSIGWTTADIQSERWSSEYAEGYRIEYDQDIPKFLKKYGKQWGTTVGKTTLDNGTEVWSMAITDSMQESVLTEGQPLYSDRDTESVSNRSLLANAFAGVAQDDIEKQKILEYKGKIDLIEAEERKLGELNEKIKELSFAKGPRDTKAIRGLQFEAKQTANRINTYDKQLLRLEASKPLQDVLAREKKQAYQRAEQKGKDALAAYREKATKTQRELLERWQESRKKGIESRERTAMRHKVQSVVGELNSLLLSNDKKRHVPDSLKKAVADALSLVNMDTVAAEERAAKYAALIEKETDPDKIDAYTVTMENILRQGEKMGQRLKELRDAYEEIQESADPDIANAYDPVIAGSLKELSQSIGNTSLRNMTTDQLSDVYDMYRMVLTRVRDANKAFAEGISANIGNIASNVIREVRAAGGEHTYRAAILDPVRKFQWDNLKPVYAMERLGSPTMGKVFETVRAGEDTWAKDVVDARKYYLDQSKKYDYNSWDFNKKTKFKSASGLEFELTLEQILSLYAYSKRDQAADHLRLGGFVFDSNIETYKEKGSKLIKYKVNTAEAHQVTPDILADITGTLTKEQKAFVDEMQDYLSTVMGAKGNEVTMKMYGVKLFKEKFYFPLKSAKQFMFEQNEVSGEVRIKNSGFTNKVVAKANNPVILNNFMDVWAGHVNDMSMYHAFVLPLEDFNRVFNYNSPKSESEPSVSVKGTIQNAYSPAAVSYMKQLITDLNGGVVADPRETFAKSMIAKFKKAKVFSSASVVIQQPSAIGRAFALVDPKYFHFTKDGMKHSELWNEVKQYAPVAIIKEMGYFDTDMGRSTKEFITAKEYSGVKEKAKALFADGAYRDAVLSKAPALADELTWCAIWNAVKRETKAKNPGLGIKSEELLQKAGERFTEVITKTQVYDSVLSRSANMRSKSGLMSMVTSFMAEPTTTINMIEDAMVKAKKGDKRYAARAFASAAVSVILNNALVALVYGARDDDDDETYLEKYSQAFVSNTLDDINPITYYPYLKDMWSILQGYDVERADMSLVGDVADALEGLTRAYTSENGDVTGAWWDIAGSVANIVGIPAQNISRDINGAINLVKTLIEDASGRDTTWGSMGDAIGEAVRDSLPVVGWLPGETKIEKLYDAIVNGDNTYVDRLRGGYKDDSSYRQAVRKALRENDPRIKEAAEARVNGDTDRYISIANTIIGEENFDRNDIVAAINAEVDALLKLKKPKEPTT